MRSFYSGFRRAYRLRPLLKARRPPARGTRPFRVLSITNNKGGVGKTTLATNLAVYLRALREDREVLILGLDDQSMIDRMFASDAKPPRTWRTVAAGLREGRFTSAIRPGRYGVHYVPSAPDVTELNRSLEDPLRLRTALERTAWQGLVIVDTKSDLGILTRNALAASDLILIPVRDDASLREAVKVFKMMEQWGWPQERARIVLSMLDRRIKYREGETRDLLALLLGEIRRRQYPLLGAFVSNSPAIESLYTNPEGHALPILQGAPGSLVNRQMEQLAEEVSKILDAALAPTDEAPSRASDPGERQLRRSR